MENFSKVFEQELSKVMKAIIKAGRELYYWQYGSNSGTNFSSMLFILIQKADGINYEKIRNGFPEYIKVYEMWQESKNPEKFLKKFIKYEEKRK